MVLIKSERKNKIIDYDFWLEVQDAHRRTQKNESDRETITKRIKELLEEEP